MGQLLRVTLVAAGLYCSAAFGFTLSTTCPPGFELERGGCFLRSLYRQYDSLQSAGVGGLKSGLPALREGFTPQQIDLGRYLFFDPLLSADHSLSCASCHQPQLGFADGRARSAGVGGELLERSAPSLWNVAFQRRLFWDARADSLEAQMQGPLYDPREMATTPASLLEALRASAAYRALFATAFPGTDTIVLASVYTALAAFESSLISLNSRYDLYAHGAAGALSDREKEGLNVFRSFVARCAECHTPPLFSNQQLAVIGVPEADGAPLDPGAQRATGDASLRGAFRVPSLRNVALTAPYMHAGNFATLRAAVAFYNGGRGHAVPAGEQLNIHWHIWNPRLSDEEVDRLVDFLGALSDQSFMPQVPAQLPSGLPPVHNRPEAAAGSQGE
ncbi:cytochrome-c peroxidase [Haliea sp. E17]|uniref:cytochrome-c peroxidase n=1 Tax=Haliea sp. E17 TaxID=3401576 RepID=UPI003AAA3C72